jgi:pimeloyl-ACP methyl ester carboxylesterase
MKSRKPSMIIGMICATLLMAVWLAAGTSAHAADTSGFSAGVPPLPELQFSQIPAAKRANYDGDRFSYMESGPKNAPVVLLLHGVGANSMHWRFQYPVLGQRYHVIAFNAPGYLLSDNLVAEKPTCENYGDAVNDFLTSLGIEKVYLFGNSFGSAVGQCFAARYPQKVVKVVFTGTFIGEGQATDEQRKAFMDGRKQQIKDGGYSFGSGRIAALVGKNTPEDKLNMIRGVLRATNRQGFIQACYFLYTIMDSRQLASKLTMPILMVQGTEDQVTPPARNSYVLKPLLGNAKLVEVPGAGHLPEFEMPDIVNKAVLDFFAE